MEHDVRATLSLFHLRDFKFGRTVTRPLHRLSALLITTRNDVYTLAHHKGRVETKPEVANNCIRIVLIAFEEVGSAREGNLVDVLFNLLGRHTDTAVANRKCLSLSIYLHLHGQVAKFATHLSARTECLQLLRSINGICHNFTKENLVVAIQEFLNHGENVLRRYSDLSFFHK